MPERGEPPGSVSVKDDLFTLSESPPPPPFACSDVNYCGGTTSTSSDMIVAASAKLFHKWGGGTKSKLCGQSIVLTAKGKAVNATIRDECPECAEGSIDMS